MDLVAVEQHRPFSITFVRAWVRRILINNLADT